MKIDSHSVYLLYLFLFPIIYYYNNVNHLRPFNSDVYTFCSSILRLVYVVRVLLNPKPEYRNSKQIRNPNIQCANVNSFKYSVLDFVFWSFEFVSCFGFRISDFLFNSAPFYLRNWYIVIVLRRCN